MGRFSSRRDPGGASAVDARFRGLLENFAVPTNLVSPDGLFQFVNQAMCDMLGYDAETLLTMNWLEVTAPDDRAEGVHAVEDLLAGRQDSHRQTKRYLRADGQPVWGDLTINCVRDSDGTVEFLVGQIIDITEQVELRAKHAEADGRFRRMMETSNVAMALVAPDGKLEVVNQALCQLFGYDEETLKTKTWQEMTPASYLEADLKNTEDLLHGRLDTYRVTKEHIHADGHLFWVDLSVSCLRDAGGAVQYLVAQCIDITEQVELRAKQAEADARFRRLMETSNVAMALVTAEGRLEVVNEALCRLLGYDEATLKTMTWQELTPASYLEADVANTLELLAGRLDTYRVTKQFIGADGRRVWVDLSASCLRDAGGAVQYLVAQGVDISEEVAARELLAHHERENRVLADRLQAEMLNAAKYVESILPGDLDGPVEVSSRYLPSLDLGGDGFHFRWLDDDHLEVYLIDVSGHGIRPALLSVSVHNLIRSGSLPVSTLLEPDRVLDTLNGLFQMDDQGGDYFTIWYGMYQLSTRTLRYASAGHPPALVLTRAGDGVTATSLYAPASPVGMFADTVYECHSYQVPSGGQLLLYSDGVFELPVESEKGRPPALQGFIDLCTELAAEPGWSLDDLLDRVRALSPTGDFDDDCALVLLTFP